MYCSHSWSNDFFSLVRVLAQDLELKCVLLLFATVTGMDFTAYALGTGTVEKALRSSEALGIW